MKRFLAILLIFCSLPAFAQVDRKEVRAGNRKFKKSNYKEAEIDYRKAVVKDSLSFAGEYNLASSLYRQEDFEGAGKALETIKEVAPGNANAADYYYNLGDVALKKQDYSAAVEAFKQSLLLRPEDLDAKENYIYAKEMLKNQQGGGGGNNNQNDQQNQDQQQDQDNQQDKNDQNQDQNQDNNGEDNQDNQQEGQQPQQISEQQARAMLQAIQAKEKETQDKVNKEKAAALKSRQKEKNW